MAVLAGCASAPAPAVVPPPPPDPGPPPPQAAVGFEDADWGQVESPRFPLIVSVPEARGWQVDAAEQNWLLLHHSASQSSLHLRVWRAGRRARPVDCSERAALWLPIVGQLTADERVAEHRVEFPQGFDTRVDVYVYGLSEAPEPLEVEGRAHVFGAAPSRCIAVLFSTRARGTGAEREVAQRLRLFVDRAVPSLKLRGIEDRAGREPMSPPSR